ncbi:MAG: aldehyde:ferredoxin oxidoreductase, partial [Clostridiales bacterium]|nr:aldehyde:ferredoxin oxidoreductase [Clostridiales bacterium]
MPTKYKGYMGTVIQIDLSNRSVAEYPWSDKERRLFIGGKTMAAKIIGDTVGADTEPLSEDNVIVVSTGPFTGSGCPSTSRFNMSTRSPLTGFLTSSNCGGNFGYYLKKAGYDALVIRGKADSPVWIEIENDRVTFHDASDLWGMKTGEVQTALDGKLAEARGGKPAKNGKIVIGPAGENLVRYASVVSNERMAGRGGVGAVMGFKNLKGITVSGNHTVSVYDREKLDRLNRSWVRYLKSHPLT